MKLRKELTPEIRTAVQDLLDRMAGQPDAVDGFKSNLVLTMRAGDKVQIGENVVMTVLPMRHGEMRVAFEAPREVFIATQRRLKQLQRLIKESRT